MDAGLGCLRGVDVGGGCAGKLLDFEGDPAKDGGEGRAVEEVLGLEAARAVGRAVSFDQGGEKREETLVKPGDLRGRRILEGDQIDPCFQHGELSPDIGATQGEDLPELHADHLQGLNAWGREGRGRAERFAVAVGSAASFWIVPPSGAAAHRRVVISRRPGLNYSDR